MKAVLGCMSVVLFGVFMLCLAIQHSYRYNLNLFTQAGIVGVIALGIAAFCLVATWLI